MSILTQWLLIPPVNARLIGRYRDYRRHGASASARRSAVSG
ncbi:cellulose synthase catalytic subunit [Escherichia coli]|uniref:Cellulose synthase catalytic subunit n=1 Tax=Escherichia coli TaxID=562 RepID=A0A377AKN2_ECOLX|nr:cellulose synthase catalytic subunit [Escherichia coli]